MYTHRHTCTGQTRTQHCLARTAAAAFVRALHNALDLPAAAQQVPEISIDADIFQQAHALALQTLSVGNIVRIVNSQGYLG